MIVKKQTEKELQKMVCEYIKLKYPNVLFNSDMAGIKLTIGQAIQSKNLRSHNGFPDLAIYEPKKKLGRVIFRVKSRRNENI